MSELLSLRQLDPTGLQWHQPAIAQKYELSSAAGTYARLELKKLAGALGVGSTSRVAFTFKRQGMLKSHISIRLSDSEKEFATYEPNFTGKKGKLTYSGGQYVEFEATNFPKTEWQWLTPEGDGLLGYRIKGTGKPKPWFLWAKTPPNA